METVEVTEALPPEDVFVECVQCGHRSYMFVFLKNGMLLEYCLHHYNEHRARLGDLADTVVDRSYLLGKDR